MRGPAVNDLSLVLIVSTSLLFAIGLLMVFNTSSAEIIDRSLNVNIYTALYKQFACGCVGLVLGVVVYKVGYANWLRWSPLLLCCLTLCLAALFVPSMAQTIHGARRWFSIFGFSFQPSEAAKVLIPAVFIRWFLQQETIDFKAFLKILTGLAVPAGLILIEPDNGTVAILVLLMVVLFLLVRIRWRYWALPLASLIALGSIAALQMPHVPDRIRVYLHPELDLRGKGHQPHQAKIAAGSGGLFGRGLGESLQKLNYLPEARSDYIAAIYAEEMGFVGMLVLIGLYLAFAYAGFSIALKTEEKGAFLLASVVTFLIAIQAFLNLGIVSGLLPSKGMTLPFFSQGGCSLIVNVAIVFLLLDISRKSEHALGKRRV